MGAHDDVVMALALAVYAAPESAPIPLGSQVLLGSSAGGCGEKCKSGSVLGQEQKKADIKENNQVLA